MGIKISIFTQSQPFPAGTVAGGFLYFLDGDNGYSKSQNSPDVTCTFADATEPGTYTAIVRRVDSGGNPLGANVTAQITITADGSVNVDVPTSLALALV